jgi:hypothetical protein
MSYSALGILLLIFLSKVSLGFAGVPSQVSFAIFQHGLHPYLNIVLSFLFGVPVVFALIRQPRQMDQLSRSYRTLVFFLLVILSVETILQHIFMEHQKGLFVWAALASTSWLILLFGIFIPVLLEPKIALRFLSSWSLNFVVLSLILWVLRPDMTFKGGRFIGIFKHIPYMVTCATIGIIFTLGRFEDEKNMAKRAWFAIGIVLSFLALLLTGTRSALAAALMAVLLWVLRAPAGSSGFRFFKYSTALVMTVVILLFGTQMANFASDIATGKKALFEREAQDGVASRIEEVERGWEYFQTSPWIGQGLLSKFSGQDDLDVSSYNSFKDPHNIFASAGVVGGWPFIVWTGFFLICLVILSIQGVLSDDTSLQIFAIYAIVQIPILIIYHWHLSLGGMADRIYWLVFGYLAIHSVKRQKPGISIAKDPNLS